MRAWLSHNLHSLKIAAQSFQDTPLATLFTVLVIGVAAALPAGLYVLLANLDRAASGVKPQAEITVFLKQQLSEAQARTLGASLSKQPDIALVRFVHKREGVKKLEDAGLSEIAAGLPDNPLPHALIVTPKDPTPTAIDKLGARLKDAEGIERVLMDTDWINRLYALMGLGRDLVFILSAMLALALGAITANTIRLQIYAKRAEIEVASLIGATDRFIRRPFLYFGSIQGFAGGVAAWLLVLLGTTIIEGSVARVAGAYGTNFLFVGLALEEFALLLVLCTSLGWLGAFLAVDQTLRKVEQA